jgi:hypothetical protein
MRGGGGACRDSRKASQSRKVSKLQASDFCAARLFHSHSHNQLFTNPNSEQVFPNNSTAAMQMPDMPIEVPVDDPNADTEW